MAEMLLFFILLLVMKVTWRMRAGAVECCYVLLSIFVHVLFIELPTSVRDPVALVGVGHDQSIT